MKKRILILLCGLLCLGMGLLFSGCGGTGDETATGESAAQEETQSTETPFFIGNWGATTAVVDGNTVDAYDVFGGTFVLIFKEDGTCLMALDSQYSTLNWTRHDDGTITLTGSSTYEISFPEGSEDTMIAVIKGVDVTLEKLSDTEETEETAE